VEGVDEAVFSALQLDRGAPDRRESAMSSAAWGEPRVAALYRYPMKGLSGEKLTSVNLAAGGAFPMDRAFAFENGPSGFDPAAPTWQSKIKFLCLMRHARLAALSTRYYDASGILTVEQDGEIVALGDLASPAGRIELERFFEGYMAGEKRGPIRFLTAPGHSFSDVARKVVSIINLESVADLEGKIGRSLHPLRFRANLYVEGLTPWSELRLIGRRLVIGACELKVLKATERCAATEVNPDTAERDIDVPDALARHTGDIDCGIYAEVTRAGRIADGDPITIGD
jgi:uncharacterized protein YcbX